MHDFNIILIMGLPGSGKTHYAHSIMDSKSFLIDDPSRNSNIFKEALESGLKRIIIVDPLMILATRESIEKFIKSKFSNNVILHWIYFENDLEQSWTNHLNRNINDPRDITKSFVEMLSKKYIIPSDIIPIKVYKNESN